MKTPRSRRGRGARGGRHRVTREQLAANRYFRPLVHRLGDEALWRFTRESVARGMALGLFAGFIIPIGQIMLAVLTALPLRGNLVVASTATLVTNPLTFPAIYYAAYRTGRAIVGDGALPAGGETMWLHEPGDWLAGATLPTILGLLVFALSGLVLGYLGVRLGWRGWIAWRWIRRPNRRQPSDAALLLSPLQLPPAFDLTAQPREGPAAGRSAS